MVYMASAEREPIGALGQSPEWGPGAKPLVRESAWPGGEAGSILIPDAKTRLKLKR